MKKILYLLLSVFIISCSSDENTEPTIGTQSYTAEIGDLIKISGTNLGNIKNIRIFNENHIAPGITIYYHPSAGLNAKFFETQTDTEITFFLPELYTESYIMQVGEYQIPLNIKGFIPLFDILKNPWEKVTGIKVINHEKALGRSDRNLYLLENGYYEARKISSNVYFFDVLDNGDSWYATRMDLETYNIFYSSAGSYSYAQLASFQIRDLDISGPYPSDIVITPEKQIFISTSKGIFILKNGLMLKDTEVFPGLDAHPLNERTPFDLKLTPDGKIYGKIYSNDQETKISFYILDTQNNSFSFSEKYSTVVEGPAFYGNIGYLYLPMESRLLKSSDSGNNWSESQIPLPISKEGVRSGKLNVLDANTVMVFPHSDKQGSLPHTTAFLTTDGGITWKIRKQFNFPKEKDKFIYFSDFTEKSGLLYLTDYTYSQLYKYIH